MWRTISEQALHCCSWGDGFVVYNDLSGDTHLLGPAAAHALMKLRQSPSDTRDMAELLAPVMRAKIDDEFLLQVDQLLVELNTLSLIEQY